MNKFEFSPAGVVELNLYLNTLLEVELALTAAALAGDFKAWTAAHFDLSPSQITYLNELPVGVIDFLASQCSIAVANRLPIILIKPEQKGLRDKSPAVDNLRASKLIKPKSSIEVEADEEGYTTTGEVEIEISY